MVSYRIDNKETEDVVRRLVDVLVAEGAYFDDSLIINCTDGDFSLSTSNPVERSKDKLIYLPASCLLLVDNLKFSVQGDDLVVIEKPDDMAPLQQQIMELMLDIYNLTGKIQDYRDTAPWIQLKDHDDIYNMLLEGRKGTKFEKYGARLKEGGEDDVVAEAFIGTRTLSAIIERGAVKRRLVIMPVVDFLNHHSRAMPFRFNKDEGDEKGLTIFKSCPCEGSDECYVQYGRYDALDTYMTYGYVEEGAALVRSVPVELDVPDVGVISAQGRISTAVYKNLAESTKDLHPFLPGIASQESKYMKVSHLIIPSGNSPYALRRVLLFLMERLRPIISKEQMKLSIQDAEREVIRKNMEYYDALKVIIEKNNSIPMDSVLGRDLSNIVRVQRDKIQNYPLLTIE